MNQQTIYKIFIFTLFFASYGCNQTPRSKTIATPAKIDSFKRPIDEAKTKSIIGNPAVVYRSQDLGETWSEFDKGLPNEATLSGIKQYGNKIYMSTDYHGVFIAIDGENNWIELNNAIKRARY